MIDSINSENNTTLAAEYAAIPAWLTPLLNLLKITADDTAELCYQKSDVIATRLALHTRRLFNFILVFQGAAVLAPSLWLIVLREQLNVSFAAFCVVFQLNVDSHNLKNGWPVLEKRNNSVAL